MNEVALRANDVLRNDVMLRINDVALCANGFYPTSCNPPPKCAIIKPERRWGYDKARVNEKSYFVKCCFEAS